MLDDHPVVALGVAAYLESRPGFRVVHRETSARSLLEKLGQTPCDVALIDFYLPQEPWDGVNYLRRLRRYHPNLAIITFSAGNLYETQYAAFRAGSNGYLAKQWGMVLLPDMIRGVLNGKAPFLSVEEGKIRPLQPTHPQALLTTSEVEILRHISQGLSVTQIAVRLMRSKRRSARTSAGPCASCSWPTTCRWRCTCARSSPNNDAQGARGALPRPLR